MHFKWPLWLLYKLWIILLWTKPNLKGPIWILIFWKGHFWMEMVACEPTSTWQCNMHLRTTPLSFPGGRRRQESGLQAGTWQDKLRRQGIWCGVCNVGVVCSTVCAAVNDWAAWKISGSRSRCKAWLHCGCGCAGPGSWSWRMTWRSEDTCEVWPLCATWSGSACQTYWRRSPHTSGTYRQRHRNGRAGWKNKKEEGHMYGQGDTRKWEKMG